MFNYRSCHFGRRGAADHWETTEQEIEIGNHFKVQHPGHLFHGQWRGVVDATIKV